MICERFDEFCDGIMTTEEFARHAQNCPSCSEQAALDTQLDQRIMELRKPIQDEGLWERIAVVLIQEKERTASQTQPAESGSLTFGALFSRRWPVLVPASAALVVIMVLGVQHLRNPTTPSGILTSEALTQVEIKEKEYLGAIEVLERQAQSRIAAADSQMMSLYRDKLATIDSQIVKCREALEANPGNAHIRRYLLAALHDKKQTLVDILGSTT
jgi:hypothetical protein